MIKQEGSALLSGGADSIERIRITAYEPAFGIIGDPAKRNPKTRQSADHSMVYIISTLIRKAFEKVEAINEAKD
jgi:2-methylcitrate dehydratase